MTQKMEWISNFGDNNSTTSNIKHQAKLELNPIENKLGMEIKLMLQTCGIGPFITPDTDNPNLCRLYVCSFDLKSLIELGFNPQSLDLKNHTFYNRGQGDMFVRIEKIVDNGRIDDTFCFTEPKRNAGIFNGILTGQCAEIIQYSDDKESAVCNLASIALPSCVNLTTTPPSFDFEMLHKIIKVATYNLNKVIDINYYPTEKTRLSNFRHRSIGVGVQGLADVFMMLDMPFESETAKQLNKDIFETLYHGALEESCIISQRDGPYETFSGSPASQGILQFDLWNSPQEDNRYDWTTLKSDIKIHGLRNSLMLAIMPTASTSQILGYNECSEPITSNIYSRRTVAGEFILTNKYLMKDLLNLGLWDEKMKNYIISNNGSVQNIMTIPENIREKYKTVWEISMKSLIDMAADRGRYICQSQSLNLWLEDPTYASLTSMHFYGWTKGLKTGIYYLRRRAKHQAQQFTIEPEKAVVSENTILEEEDEICEMCSA
jgi:ribonucleotide reductase alpha subunit